MPTEPEDRPQSLRETVARAIHDGYRSDQASPGRGRILHYDIMRFPARAGGACG